MEARAGDAPAPAHHPSGSAVQAALAPAREEMEDSASTFPGRVTRKRPATAVAGEDFMGSNPDFVTAGGSNVDGCDGQNAESDPSHRQGDADASATEPGQSFQTRHPDRSEDGGGVHGSESHSGVDADAAVRGRPAKTPRLAGCATTAPESASASETSKTAGAAVFTASGGPGHAVDSHIAATSAPNAAPVVTSADKGEGATRGGEEASEERPLKIPRHRRGRVSGVGQDDGSSATPTESGVGSHIDGSGSAAVAERSVGGSESACSSNGTAASQRFSDVNPICGRSRAPSGTPAAAVPCQVELEQRIAAARHVSRGDRPGERVNSRSARRHGGGAHRAQGLGEYLDRKRYPDGGPRDAGEGSAGEIGASHVEGSEPLERVQMGVDHASISRRGRERGRAHGTRDASVRAAGHSNEEGRARRTSSRGHREGDAGGSGGGSRSARGEKYYADDRRRHRRRESDRNTSGEQEEVVGAEAVEGLVQGPEGLTSDDFQCNICWEMLARPVTLACGHTACEACMAKYLRAQAQAQAQIGNLRANRISCPAGCQRMIPLVLPQVTTMVQKLLARGFPRVYKERLREADSDSALVTQVRRVAEDAATDARRRRRRHHHGIAAGAAGMGGVGGGDGLLGVGLDGAGREVMGFGNVPPGFIHGLRGQPNAARFRLDVAVPQREIAPTVSRWYKRMGLALFACLCLSWHHRVFSARRNPGRLPAGVAPDLSVLEKRSYINIKDTLGQGEIGGFSRGNAGDTEGDGDGTEGECPAGEHDSVSMAAGRQASSWLFGLEMNAQEFIAHNRWSALRSFYPANASPWNSALYLFLSDPILQSFPAAGPPAGSPDATSVEEAKSAPSPPSSWLSALDYSALKKSTELVSVGVGELFRALKSHLDAGWKRRQPTIRFARDLVEDAARSSGETSGVGDDYSEDFAPVDGRLGGDGGWGAGEQQGDASASPDSHQQPSPATFDDAPSWQEQTSQQQPRRLFLEFFGPVVGFFLWLGFSNRGAELMTVAATQLCPLVAAAPLLRLSTRAVDGSGSADDLVSLDFSIDLVIFGVLRLSVITATLWAITWKIIRRERGVRVIPLMLQTAFVHLLREIIIVTVMFPAVEHVLFHYFLQWQSRYLVTWVLISFRIFVMRLLAILRVGLLVAGPFVADPTLHTLETLWCHLFTYLLLGTRFFNAFFADEPRRPPLDAGRAARRWARAVRGGRVGPPPPPADVMGDAVAQAVAIAFAPGANAHIPAAAGVGHGPAADRRREEVVWGVAEGAAMARGLGRRAPVQMLPGVGAPLNVVHFAPGNAPVVPEGRAGNDANIVHRDHVGGVAAAAGGGIDAAHDGAPAVANAGVAALPPGAAAAAARLRALERAREWLAAMGRQRVEEGGVPDGDVRQWQPVNAAANADDAAAAGAAARGAIHADLREMLRERLGDAAGVAAGVEGAVGGREGLLLALANVGGEEQQAGAAHAAGALGEENGGN